MLTRPGVVTIIPARCAGRLVLGNPQFGQNRLLQVALLSIHRQQTLVAGKPAFRSVYEYLAFISGPLLYRLQCHSRLGCHYYFCTAFSRVAISLSKIC